MLKDTNVAAALLMVAASGSRFHRRQITDANRVHVNYAPTGSALEAERMAAAEAKRARKRARFAASGEVKS